MKANEKDDNTNGKAFKAKQDKLAAEYGQGESKRKRRRGSLAAELARDAQVTLHLAKQCIKICKHAPELLPFIESGTLKCREAVKILACARLAPEILPALANGSLDLDWFLRELRKSQVAPTDFDERVEQSFKSWLNKWPKDSKTRRRIWQIVDDILGELIE
jgi:hypothetical protein